MRQKRQPTTPNGGGRKARRVRFQLVDDDKDDDNDGNNSDGGGDAARFSDQAMPFTKRQRTHPHGSSADSADETDFHGSNRANRAPILHSPTVKVVTLHDDNLETCDMPEGFY